MAKEIEIKLLGRNEETLRGVFALPFIQPYMIRQPVTTAVRTYYVDTPDLDLAENGFAFRIRLKGNRWKAAVKRGKSYRQGLYVRDEWEVDISYPSLDFGVFQDAELIETLKSLVGKKRRIILFDVSVDRMETQLLFRDETRIEIVLDRGKIRSYGLEEMVLELELELKSGNITRLVSLGDTLKRDYCLREGKKSKYARGLALFRKALGSGAHGGFVTEVEGGISSRSAP